MSIATVEDLSALDTGTEVVVTAPTGRVSWVKHEDGRMRHATTGALVRPEAFVGSVAVGAVMLAVEAQPHVGEVIVGARTNIVVAIDGDTVVIARFVRDAWSGFVTRRPDQIIEGVLGRRLPDEERPTWVIGMLPVLTLLRQSQQEVERLRALPVPERLVTSLHGYAASVSDNEFDDLLYDNGIGRQRMHASEVRAWGTLLWEPSYDDARQAVNLGPEFDVEVDSIEVRWDRTVTVERQGVGCTCDEIDVETFREWLPDGHRNLEYEVSCA